MDLSVLNRERDVLWRRERERERASEMGSESERHVGMKW